MNQVLINDTTLRDGEQAAGVALSGIMSAPILNLTNPQMVRITFS